MIFKNRQRGQALVLIALAAVALFAFAALAIDGSRVFSDRRHSQNASDTAAYAAALAKVRGKAPLVWKQAGKDRAITNGYDESDGVTEVWVYTCEEWLIAPENPTHEPCKGLPGGAQESEYVYVRIKSVVPMFFAKIIGWSEMTNYTDAVVHASPPKVVPWYDGNALVSTMEGCPPTGYPHDPFTVTGHSGTTVVSSGILVNSDCAFPDAYDQGGSSYVTTDKGVCVIGDAESTNTNPPPDHDCTPVDPEKYVLPETPSCSGDGEILENAPKDYTATPGNYNSPFPNKSPAGNLKLLPGIYCLNKGISLNSSWFITTDLDGDSVHDSDSEGVFFYVPDGDVTFNGNSEIHIHAISAPWTGLDKMYVNMFMYVPPENHAVVTITGSDGSSFTGTILAPTSHVKLSGGSTTSGGATDGTVTLDAQIIGYSVAISGNGTLNILYTLSNNATAVEKPVTSMKE